MIQKALVFHDENIGKRDNSGKVWNIASIERRFGLTPNILRQCLGKRRVKGDQ
jgi:hypothetical protein